MLSSRPVLALDLGGTQIRAAVVLPDGTRVGRIARPTPVDDGPEAVIEASAAALRQAANSAQAAGGTSVEGPIAIGISAPGPINPWTGVIVSPPNLGTAFHGVPIAAELEQRLNLPAWLERDTNVAALGEMAYGAARGCADFLYLTVSTGFGGSIVSRGELILGPDGTAGELGHLQVEREGPLCGCGGTGHVEALCSGRAIARDARTALETGRSPFLTQRAAEKAAATTHGAPDTTADRAAPLDARDVADGEVAGDPFCVELMGRARGAFAAAIVGAVNLLNPTLIVVGGSIAEHQGDLLFQPARDAVAIGAFPVPGRRMQIVPALLGGDVSLAGAYPLVVRRFGDPAWRRPEATELAAAAPAAGVVPAMVDPAAAPAPPTAAAATKTAAAAHS